MRTLRRHLATSERFGESFLGLVDVHLAVMERIGLDLTRVTAERDAAMEHIAILTGGQALSDGAITEES
jgi:hypothetical protein